MEPSEEWRDAPGYETSYEVSNLGRVRSKPYIRRNPLTGGESNFPGKILIGGLNRGGYRQYTLRMERRNTTRTGHRLVCAAFHGPAPIGRPLAIHVNGLRSDNRADNLRWGSNAENMLDKRRHGTDHEANKTHCPQGHEYSGANLILDAGSRKCRECVRARQRERYWGGRVRGTL